LCSKPAEREIDGDGHTVVGRIRVEKKFEKTRFSTNTQGTGKRRYYSLLLLLLLSTRGAISTASTKIVIMHVACHIDITYKYTMTIYL